MQLFSIFNTCVGRLFGIWNYHSSFEKKTVGIQKLYFVRKGTFFVHFSHENVSNDNNETYKICSLHVWEGYRLLGTDMTVLETNRLAFKILIMYGHGRVLCAFHRIWRTTKTMKVILSFRYMRDKVIGRLLGIAVRLVETKW